MRHQNFTAFDEFVVGATSTSQVTTSNEFNARLGHFDQMAIMVVVDNINATGTFSLQILHSADGRNFTSWSGVVDINMTGLVVNANNVGFGSVPSTSLQTPLLSYVKFSMYFTTTAQGHVRVTVTQRDQGS